VTRVCFYTFGCKANQYDTEVIRQALEGAGAVPVDDPSRADVAVVNSCTVTHVSESKLRGLVRRLYRGNPTIRTIVTGCAAALDSGTLAELPGVHSVLGGSDPGSVLDALGLGSNGVDPVLRRFAAGSRAWLKIQDGCDEHCTFCATRRARGHSRSRHPCEIISEAGLLAEEQPEIVLTGIHLGAYGRDLGDGFSLGSLVEQLVESVPAVRFRLSSVEATEVDERIGDVMSSNPNRLAPHLHAPLQSGSDRVLRRMGRNWYTAGVYRERLEKLAGRIPRLGLGADVMVGFPGENDGDFAATQRVIESIPFTYLHVFQYSERAETPAVGLGPPEDPRISRERSAELRELARDKASAYHRLRDGEEADVVLVRHRHGRYEGLTEDYLSVYLATDAALPRRFPARLRSKNGTLWADPIID
jgi:threonylcarbamoyladenosine tRNA methylthiotransferase MtaB